MKNITNVTLWCAYLFINVHICDARVAYLDDIANLVCTFHKSYHLLKLSNMLMGNICNWLLQDNGAITRVLAYCKSLQDESDRGLISCIGNCFKPLDNIRRIASLARNSSITST